MQENNNDKVLEDVKNFILKTGFPFEIYTSNILDKMGWGCDYNKKFINNDNEECEIDLIANKSSFQPYYRKNKNMHDIVTSLVIECKKSENKVWVFYERDKIDLLKEDLLLISNWGDDYTERILNRIKINPYQNVPKATICQEVIYNKDKKESVKRIKNAESKEKNLWSAELNIKQAIPYLFSDEGEYGIWANLPSLRFIFPIIAYDGDILLAKIKQGNMVLEKVNRVQLITNLPKTKYGNNTKNMIVDIINKSKLQDIFTERALFHSQLIEAVNSLKINMKFRIKKEKEFDKWNEDFLKKEDHYFGIEYKKE